MQRATWTGSISFGLVNVPVKLYTSTANSGVKLCQVTKAGEKINSVRMAGGARVAWEDTYRGVETEKGQYLAIEPSELEALAPKRSKTIEIESFATLQDIDPFIISDYHIIGPDKAGGKSYALLREALRRSKRVGIGRVVLSSRERLVALQVRGDALVMATLAYANEINDPTPLLALDGGLPAPDKATLNMAIQIVKSMDKPFVHASFEDAYSRDVTALVEHKLSSKTKRTRKTKDPSDLMAALEASLKTTKTRKTKVAA